jgi:PhzF family phenazine biosynthesis protein
MRNENFIKTPLYWVDAFTDEPFRGNAAAVCILKKPLNAQVMQSIAAEMGTSETAFIHSTEEKPLKESKNFSLRWFTPKVEVKLCGHATLAAAAVLFHEINVSVTEVTFETKSGKLAAKKVADGICLDFPVETFKPVSAEPELLDATGITEAKDPQYSERLGMLLINLASEEELRNLQPDFERLKNTKTKKNVNGIIITSKGKPPYDFISRFFAPQLGINEDPVTGSAHSVLTPYWSKILAKTEMSAYQASARGGKLKVRLRPDNRVDIIGNTFTLMRGELHLPRSLCR